MLKNERMQEYADLLQANGFQVYESKSGEYFMYSQVVDGRECFGLFQHDTYRTEAFRTYEHRMPIKPSREFGSAILVVGVEQNDFTVEAARKVAQPTNRGLHVGPQLHRNYREDYGLDLYVKREG